MQTEHNFDNELVAAQVKKLMEKNAVTKRHQVNQLSQILKLSFSHAHRKMKGESPWTLAQIHEVARHFGEPASTLLSDTEAAASPDEAHKQSKEALLTFNSPKELQCLIRVAGPVTGRNTSEYVACHTNEGWRVFPADQAQPSTELFMVDLIEIVPQITAIEARIAVVDDEPDSVNNLCDYLSANGFKTSAFYTIPSFQQEYQKNTHHFDAFVIDWWLQEETAEQCIREIRELSTTQIPIFLLTGELKTGKANEADINNVIRKYNITCVEKPARMSLLVANIEKELGLH